MQIASYEKAKTAPSDTPNKNGTQQKKQHLMHLKIMAPHKNDT